MLTFRWLAGITMLGVAATVLPGQQSSSVDTSGWTPYRNATMGFELRYPTGWHLGSGSGTAGPNVSLAEPLRTGQVHHLMQFWVQRGMNPQGLSVDKWYASQFRWSAALPVTRMNIGGRPALQMEVANGTGRHFSFFVAVNTTDIFTITLKQPPSPAQLDAIYAAVLTTIRFSK